MCTQTSVVTPQTSSVSMPLFFSTWSRSVWWKAPLPGLSITGSPVGRIEVRHDVVPGLAADQDPPHRPGIADPLRRHAAGDLGRRRVGEVRPVPLAGVDHQHAGRPRRRQRGGAGHDRGLQQRDVVAERLAEAARLEEVPLHVDDDERGAADLERDRTRLGVQSLAHAHSFGVAFAPGRGAEEGTGWTLTGRRWRPRFAPPSTATRRRSAPTTWTALTGYFWDSPRAVRLMTEGGLYGIAEIAAFRKGRDVSDIARALTRVEIVALAPDVAVATAEYRRTGSGRRGCPEPGLGPPPRRLAHRLGPCQPRRLIQDPVVSFRLRKGQRPNRRWRRIASRRFVGRSA